jgi:hypothetical protein
MRTKFFIIILLIYSLLLKGQIGNYVSNGSFEQVVLGSNPKVTKSWGAIDSSSFFGTLLTRFLPPFNVPLNAFAYQWPKHGNNYFGSSLFYINGSNIIRGYPKNRLKGKLNTGTRYCVKFYCNVTNNSTHGIDAVGVYFGDSFIDTISYCTVPLNFLNPQVHNPDNNIITDTLNWVAVTGTFVASGYEKYMVIGNFKSNSATDTVLINSTYLPQIFTDILFDAISCIEINLPAYAGPDKSIIPGDSVYIGRESDFAIDPGCIWYQLPNTTTAIDTISGMWVKPSITTTYVVKQTLECSPEKWDTVVIYINQVGLEKFKILNEELNLFPIPAKDELKLSIQNTELIKDFHLIFIVNNLGLIIREEELKFENGYSKIRTEDLPNGVYTLQLKSNSNEKVSKRFVISR